jgi:hypothetical protein
VGAAEEDIVSPRTPAEQLVVVNIVLIALCSVLFLVCVVMQLWVPAAVFLVFVFSNALQLKNRRRPPVE